MRVLLLNAGSGSLKATLAEAGGGRVVAHASADWAGPVTQYVCTGPAGARVSEEVAWRGHAEAVERALGDLIEGPGRSAAPAPPLAAVGHRVVQGGAFRAWLRWIETSLASPEDILPWEKAPAVGEHHYLVQPRSMAFLVAPTTGGEP